MSDLVILSSLAIIIILFLIAIYRINSKVINSIKNIAQFIQGRENIEKVKRKIIELKETNNNLIEEIKMGRIFYDNSIEPIAIISPNKKIISINPAFTDELGYQIEDIRNKQIYILDAGKKHPSEYDNLYLEAEEKGFIQTEIWQRKKTGELDLQKVTLIAIKNDDQSISNYITIIRTITAETETESKLKLAAKHDALTGLPNRSLFLDRLEQAMNTAKREDKVGAVMFLDLDHFKSINDTLGHHIGDLLLKEVAKRLQDSVRATDTVARLSGDEFTVILPKITKIDDAGLVAETIINKITKPYKLEDNELKVTCSVGVSVFPHDGDSIEELLNEADQAMYTAKTSGRNTFKFYSNTMNENAHAKRNVDKEIRKAINEKAFFLNYIPNYNKNNEIDSVELVLKLNTNKKELQNIDSILSLTEESSLIVELTDWIMTELAKKDLELLKFNNIKASIPISAVHFKQSNIINKLTKLFSSDDASYIQLKIDEQIIAKNVIEATDKLEKLIDYGFDVCIDSFGSGKISYNELINLKFSSIKSSKNLNFKDDKKIIDYLIATSESLDTNLYIDNVNSKSFKEYLLSKNKDNIYFQGLLYNTELSRENILSEIKKK